MQILKYRLKAKYSEEVEFEVTKTTKRTIITSTKETVDDGGNKVSARERPEVKTEQYMDEEIRAISLPSRSPAEVIVLQVRHDNGSIEDKFDPIAERPKPINLSEVMNPTEPEPSIPPVQEFGSPQPNANAYDPEILELENNQPQFKPQPLKRTGEIRWADQEQE